MNASNSPLRRAHAPAFFSSSTAGFSLVELLGVIVLIGVISLGAYIYVGNASQQATVNTKLRNAQMLNQLVSIAAATGATFSAAPQSSTNNVDTTSVTSAIASLNNGFAINAGNGNPGIPIKMNPPIQNPGSYTMTGTGLTIVFASDGSTSTPP
jgi:prepilin-type N-terminal cleavage/methylation domain-containing protein